MKAEFSGNPGRKAENYNLEIKLGIIFAYIMALRLIKN